MQPRIETVSEKKLIGKQIRMSLSDNKTKALWQYFMPGRKEIVNALTADMISMQIYNAQYFKDFNPQTEFCKWAAVEVADFNSIPKGMETYLLEGGLYAIFLYKGPSTDISIFQYIFGTWLPNSDYVLDSREHFEILGERYKNHDPDSEEEIYIPIRPKTG